ncbi:MAG TPA: hypothetical protein EYP30_07090 [Archaeoglobaceae archaeon]|nr:hypothetical protein [Archaeoglobaceae archaeon]
MENKKFEILDPLTKLRKIVVCPPHHLELLPIDFISKSWLNKGGIDKNLAYEQYKAFLDALESENIKLLEMEPSPAFRNQIFVRDTGFSVSDAVLVGRMRSQERLGEEELLLNFLEKLNVNVLKIEKGNLEGGDIVPFNRNSIIVGYGNRTDEEGIDEISKYLESFVYKFRLNDRYVHLDLCLNLIDENTLLVSSEIRKSVYELDWIKKFDIIFTNENEENTLPANVLLLKKGKILAAEENRITNKNLEKLGMDVVTVELSEILKAGGGPRCLTFPLF